MNHADELRSEFGKLVARRWFLRQCGVGLGSIALASLLGTEKTFGALTPKTLNPLASKPPQFPAKAKRVIYLFMGAHPASLSSLITNRLWPGTTENLCRLK